MSLVATAPNAPSPALTDTTSATDARLRIDDGFLHNPTRSYSALR